MDYFAVILLVIIIFTFLSDKKVLETQEINKKIDNIDRRVEEIYNDLLIIEFNKAKNEDEIYELINRKLIKSCNKYIILKDKDLKISNNSIKKMIANYINQNERKCVFIVNYEYKYIKNKKSKDILNELYIAGINYINIFSKAHVNGGAITILKREEIGTGNKKKVKCINFSPCNDIKIITNKKSFNHLLNKLTDIYDSDFKMILKSLLLIVLGVTVTTNLIHAITILNIEQIIIASMIYWCYSYVLNYMYSPIGKYRIISKYLLPIYIIIYFGFQIIYGVKRKINHKKVHAS